MSFCISMPHLTNIGSLVTLRDSGAVYKCTDYYYYYYYLWWRYDASSIIKMAASSIFDLNHIAAFGISRRTGVPNFIQIAPSSADLICHIDFLRWRSLWNNFTSVLGFGDNTFFRRSMYINIPNIVSMARGYAYAKIEYIRIRPYLLKTRIRI